MLLDYVASPEIWPGVAKCAEDPFQANGFVGAVAKLQLNRVDFHLVIAGQVGAAADKPIGSARLSTLSTYRPAVTGFTSPGKVM